MIQADSIIMLGQTGAGKSTVINAMVNKLWKVNFHDIHRFKIIGNEKSNNITESQTTDVTAYHVKGHNSKMAVNLIDCAGFSDTNIRDEDVTKKLYKFFTSTTLKIKAVCFVIKSSDNRLTPELKFVINCVLEFFGPEALPNIIAIITFAGIDDPECLELLKKEGI